MRYAILFATAVVCLGQPLQDAEKELFGARYKAAAQLYAKVLESDPSQSDAYYGLVRALLRDHRSQEAYAAADEALKKCPNSAAAQTAAGLATYRRGDLGKAEQYFRAALKLDPAYPGALQGLASIHSAVSRPKTARDLLLAAYHNSPGDPELMLAYANTLKRAEHIAALQRALAILDAESEEARNVRAHIASDLAVGDRKLRRLVSPYETSRIKLVRILNGTQQTRGVGLHVRLNRRQSALLMLDTGASGISISPKAAEHAGLEMLGDQSSDAKGIGDKAVQASFRYLVSELQAGDVTFADYPVSVFRAAKSPDYDGLIGADVFAKFLVTLDFPRMEVALEPRADDASSESDEPVDANPPASGFQRLFRFGNHLAVPTYINGSGPTLFMIDSGSSANLVDTATASEASKVHRDYVTRVTGLQGQVKQVSEAENVSLAFAGFRQVNSSLVAISLERLGDDMRVAFGGVLGMPVLSNLKVTIDYREGTARFEYKK